MAYSVPKRWAHGDIPTAAEVQKYSDGLDAIHAITGDAARNHAVLWSYENFSATFAGSDYYLVHRFRYLVYRGDGELVDPGGVYPTQTLTGDGNNYLALDLDDVSWMTPGRLYQVKDCVFALESNLTTGTSATISGGGGGTTVIIGDGGTGTGGGMEVHALDPGTWHTGTLAWANVNKTGSDLADLAARAHGSLSGVTADQHHAQAHVLATQAALGGDHSISGATAGHVLRASAATAAAFAQLQHNDLGGVTSDQHHARQHSIISAADHTVVGAQWQVVGVPGTDTLGLLTPSYNPGAAAALLRTNTDGSLILATDVLNVSGTQHQVWVNSGAPDGSAAFKVTAYANDDITVHIKQKSGQTGRLWRVSNAAGQELIVLTNNGALQSGNPGFVSGLTGWQITPEGRAEFLDGWFRGELHATVFSADEIHVAGGSILVATPGTLENDAVIDSDAVTGFDLEIEPDAGGAVTWQIEPDAGGAVTLQGETLISYLDVRDPSIGHYQIYSVGDFIRCKPAPDLSGGGIDIYDLWFEVTAVVDATDYFRYYVIKRSGTDTTLPAGAALAHYGQPGDGRILITSDLNYAPYMDVFTVGAAPWDGDFIPHTRLGRLDGVGVDGVTGVEQYGMIAGTDLSDNDAPYIVASNLQLKLHRVDLQAYDGLNQTVLLSAAGEFKLGTGVNNPNTTGLSFDPVTGNLTIGNASYPGTVTVRGAITVTGGDAATQSYAGGVATTAENNAKTAAQGYANTAQSNAQGYADTVGGNAQDYANARRVVAVTGVYYAAAPPANPYVTIEAGAAIRLGSGASKTLGTGTVAPGATGTFFLYVDVTATAPLTVSYTTDITTISTQHGVIGVFTIASSSSASLVLMPGTTYIGPAGIITNAIRAEHISALAVTAGKIAALSITADELAADSVTAAKIDVATLSAVNANTGSLTVSGALTMGTSGVIKSSGKDAFEDITAGFFLGYDTGAYRLDIGDANAYLRWTGSALAIQTNQEIKISNNLSDVIALDVTGSGGINGKLRFTAAGWGFVGDVSAYAAETYDLKNWRNIYGTYVSTSSGQINTLTTTALTASTLTLSATGGTITNAVTAWAGLTPGTGWSNYRSGSLAYCKIGEIVIVRGTLYRTNNNETTIGTLPSGVRPAQDVDSPTYIQGAASYRAGFVTIETDGDIKLGDGATFANQSISFLVINAVFTTRS